MAGTERNVISSLVGFKKSTGEYLFVQVRLPRIFFKMKILPWCVGFLVLVAMDAKQVDSQLPNRLCRREDITQYMVSGTGSGVIIQMDAVKKFVELQEGTWGRENPFDRILAEGKKTLIMEEVGRTGPVRMTYAKHHIIPFERIGCELSNLKREILKSPNTNTAMYLNVQKGLNKIIRGNTFNIKYKNKTWHIAIENLKKNMARSSCPDGTTMLSVAVDEFARQLTYMLHWTPNNIHVGPLGNIRANEPGNNIDNEILGTFTKLQKAKFHVNKRGSLPTDLFKYQVLQKNSWYTIIDLLAEIDDGPGIKGPVWEKTNPRPYIEEPEVWIVEKNGNAKICIADIISIATEEKCKGQDPKSYVGITDGRLYCEQPKQFDSLCA